VEGKEVGDNSQPVVSADDIGVHTNHYAGSDASKPSLGAYSKFLIPTSMHRKDAGRPDASKTSASAKFSKAGAADTGGIGASVSMRAQDSMTITPVRGQSNTRSSSTWPTDSDPSHGAGKETEKLAAKKLFDAGRSSPIELAAIFASVLVLSAILGIRMRRRRLASPALITEIDEHESGTCIKNPPGWHDNILELQSTVSTSTKAQEVFWSGGWWRPSSRKSRQVTICYATPPGDTTPVARNPLLEETFTTNDPVHRSIRLPEYVKHIVDTNVFQRMRHIKQLGICDRVYLGATHNRFQHSIGTGFLAYDFVKDLRARQPELMVSDRDLICVTIAGLCHDLGHPCFSHMFEQFMHSTGKDMRLEAELAAKQNGQPMDVDTQRRIERLENWTHEDASLRLLEIIFEEKADMLEEIGLCCDKEGDDFACIRELIEPPKKKLEALLESGGLRTEWSKHIRGRPVEKAWLYEIVSNWRSGLDVDKFDYFRRDALYLGVQRQFDHNRFLKAVKVLHDDNGVPTISPPDTQKDSIRYDILDLRKYLHSVAYQHKAVKKIEMHMIDILKLMDKHILITGTDGKKFSMSEAAEQLDPIAYQKLTDSFVETKLVEREVEALRPAQDEYDKRVINRNLMELVADWDVEPDVTEIMLLGEDQIIDRVLDAYETMKRDAAKYGEDLVTIKREELKCQICQFHHGMKFKDPISRLLFHSSKDASLKDHLYDTHGRPMRQRVFFFWNPSDRSSSHDLTLSMLSRAFKEWANRAKSVELMSPNRVSPHYEDVHLHV
jgi:HD superfamily phosphohydrolase